MQPKTPMMEIGGIVRQQVASAFDRLHGESFVLSNYGYSGNSGYAQ